MGTLTVAPGPEAALPPEPPQSRRAWIRAIVAITVVLVVVCSGAFAADAWTRGGTHLDAAGAGIGTAAEPLAVPVNVGVELNTRGGASVVLQSVRSTHSADIAVSYTIVHTRPGEVGIGSSLGSIASYSPVAVRGARIAQPEFNFDQTCTTAGVSTPSVCTPPASSFPDHGATFLVVTVRALRPGRWSIRHITITYKSWRRTRHVTSSYTIDGTAAAH